MHILDHNGNLADAASLSALAALLAFRRPEVTLEAGETGMGVGVGEGQRIVVHPPNVREPLPLSIHHTPLAVTFASFQVSTVYLISESLLSCISQFYSQDRQVSHYKLCHTLTIMIARLTLNVGNLLARSSGSTTA